MTVNRMLEILKSEKIRTWFDLGIFIDRFRETKPLPSVKFNGTFKEFKRNIFSKISALFAYPALKSFKKQLDPRAYNGASLLGLNGIVVKSHGGADAYAFGKAILEARQEVIKDVPNQIRKTLESQMETLKEE